MSIVIAVGCIVSTCVCLFHLFSSLQVLVDVTGEEFETLMDVLSKLKYTSTPDGAKEVAAIISEQAELTSEFQVRLYPTLFVAFNYPTLLSQSLSPPPQPQDVESIDRFTTCFRQALKFCKVHAHHPSISLQCSLICAHTSIHQDCLSPAPSTMHALTARLYCLPLCRIPLSQSPPVPLSCGRGTDETRTTTAAGRGMLI